jgi:hypothetical protein
MAFLNYVWLSTRLLSAAALSVLGFMLALEAAPAQTFDASNLRQPVDLGANWLVHAGDDPS